MTTDTYSRDKRAAVNWAGGIIATLLIAATTFLASQLIAHETAISVVKERQSMQEKRLDSIDVKLDKILDKVSKP